VTSVAAPARLTGAPRRRPAAGVRAPVLVGAIAAGALFVVALWWRDTPSVTGLAGWLTNAGRLTGLGAGYTIAVLLLLMARVPALDRGIGADRLARWHARGGRYTVILVTAHTLLITWGYAVAAHTSITAQGVTFLRSYPDVLMATVAGLLFVGIGVVSARAARSRLRYETWYYLHFYTYLAIALSFAHVFATGADFYRDAVARVAWSGLYLGVAGLLLWYRWVTPVRSARRHRLQVWKVVPESPAVTSVYLVGRYLDELACEPGQFFRWRFLARGHWWSSHPFSLSAPATDTVLRISVKAVGDHTRSIRTLRPGTPVLAGGPYGALTRARRTRKKVLLLAGGIGITPLRTLFETLPAGPGDLTLLYRVNSEEELVLREELERIARARRAHLVYLVGPPGGPDDPLRPERLAELVPSLDAHEVFVSGPPAMVAVARASLADAGVPSRHVHTECFEL
jgi:predicted ferric reductase